MTNQEGKSGGFVVFAAVVAALGGLLFGFDTAVISGTTDALQRVFRLGSNGLGFTVAIALIGTIVGSFVIGPPADRFGRKKVLFAIAIGYLVSAIGCALSHGWIEFLVARFVGGLAVGAASVVAPLYIAEIAPSKWRGRLVALNQLNVVTGILLSYLSNYLIASQVAPDLAWRWMLGIVAAPSIVFFLLLLAIPESPRWLVGRRRIDEARKVLGRLGESEVEAELKAIEATLAGDSSGDQDHLFQPRYRKAIGLAVAIAMFNQLSGINALMYYAPKIFEMAGSAKSSALLQSVAIGGTNLAFTIAAMFVIDRFGRRVLILIGSIGTSLCLGVVAAVFAEGSATRGPVVLAALIGYIAFFAFSQGAVIWVFLSEIFPNAVRAKGQALGSFTHWAMAAAVSWLFPVIAESSPAVSFAVFATMMALQFVFAWKIMPETKGGSLEDAESRLSGKPEVDSLDPSLAEPIP